MSNFNLEISGKNKSTTKGNTDWYYGGGEEAWNTIALARQGVPTTLRNGKTVGVLVNNKIVEYIWHNDDLSDTGLVLKFSPSSDNPLTNNSTIVATTVATKVLNNKILNLDANKAELNGNSTKVFKVADPVNDDDAVSKLYYDTQLAEFAFPKPYFDSLDKRAVQPNQTLDLTIKGSYFKENMTVSIGGCTVNQVTFVLGTEIKVNITSGSVEGFFNIVLNNALETTVIGGFEINLGTVYTPDTPDWNTLVGSPDLDDIGEFKVSNIDINCSAIMNQTLDTNLDFNFDFKYSFSDLFGTNSFTQPFVNTSLIEGFNLADNKLIFTIYTQRFDYPNSRVDSIIREYDSSGASIVQTDLSSHFTNTNSEGSVENFLFRLKKIGNSYTMDVNNINKLTFSNITTSLINSNIYLKFTARNLDFKFIRYIII